MKIISNFLDSVIIVSIIVIIYRLCKLSCPSTKYKCVGPTSNQNPKKL